jgi:hypothetical protein
MGLVVVDSFLFFNELDTLELRLNILNDYVDRFVIVEGDHTFTNIKKEFILENNLDRFSKWMHKISYIKFNSHCYDNPWTNENMSRDMFKYGWQDLTDNDIILVSDVDEIFRPSAIEYVKATNHSYYGMIMPLCYFKFNYMDVHSDKIGYTGWGNASRGYQNIDYPSRLRKFRDYKEDYIFLHHAGWHFSWLGDIDHLIKKINSYSHTETNTKEAILDLTNIDNLIKNNLDHMYEKRKKWHVVDLDNYFPEYILNNKEKYSQYILPDSGYKVQEFYNFNILQLQR